jgi:hypothetical protein
MKRLNSDTRLLMKERYEQEQRLVACGVLTPALKKRR